MAYNGGTVNVPENQGTPVNGDVTSVAGEEVHRINYTARNGSAANVFIGGTPVTVATHYGTLTVNPDGTFSYRQDESFVAVNGLDNNTVPAESLNDVITFVQNSDNTGSAATVTFHITGVNDAPVADADGPYNTTEDLGAPLVVTAANGVLNGDTDADNADGTPSDTLTAQLVQSTQHGVLNLNPDGSFTYTPNSNFNGVDTFIYHANDGSANSNNVTVSINVAADAATTDPYVAVDDGSDPAPGGEPNGFTPFFEQAEDSTVTYTIGTIGGSAANGNFLANDQNPDAGETVTVLSISNLFDAVTGALVGTVTFTTPSTYTITPNDNYNGDAFFDYVAATDNGTAGPLNSGDDQADQGRVYVRITSVNDAPTTGGADATSGSEDQLISDQVPAATDTAGPNEGNAISYQLVSGSVTRTLNDGTVQNLADSVLNFDNATGAYSYDPRNRAVDQALADGEHNTINFLYRAVDNGSPSGQSATAPVTLTITGTNDGPSLTVAGGFDSDSGAITDGSGALLLHGTLTAVDPDYSDTLTSSVVGVTGSPALGDTSSILGMLSVQPHNLAANPGGGAANLDWAFQSGANAFDWLGAGETQQLTYTVRVTDDSGQTADHPVTITITGTNDAPVISASTVALGTVVELPDHSVGENTAILTTSGHVDFTDNEISDTHTFTAVAQGGGYLGTFSPSLTESGGTGSFAWSFSVSDGALNTLAQGQVVKQFYDITIDDGHGGSVLKTVEVDLIGTTDAAILTSANVFVEQGPAVVTAAGDLDITDEDNPALFIVQSSTAGNWGHFSIDQNGNWNYTANQVFTLAAGQFKSDVFTVLAVDGTPTTVAVTITGHDVPAMAQQDQFNTTESGLLGVGLNLFADNGHGVDSDPDSPLQIAAVNGVAGNVGHSTLLASGARVIVNADGTFSYDPNHAFDWLTAAAGAANQFGYDSFSYTLAGGSTAMVFVNITGQESPRDLIYGNGLDNVIFGLAGNDTFLLQQSGHDNVWGMTGNDGFYFGGAYDSDDNVDGGEGTDTIALQGNTATTLGRTAGVEVILALSGSDTRFGDLANNRYDYDLTSSDSNVAAGQTLTVQATGLLPGEDLHFDGSAETDGNFRIFAGQGVDNLVGGAGSDGFFFGADRNLTGADHIDGGAGTDSLALRGNYVGGNAVVFQNGSFGGIEVLALLSGHSNEYSGQIAPGGYDYDVTMANGNVAAGRLLDINAGRLGNDEQLRFDGRAESDGAYRIFSGAGDDLLWGGDGNDTIYGAMGADHLDGGAGADTFFYRSAAESTSTHYDTITGFDWHVDRIDAPGGVRTLSQSGSGTLSTASFDGDLTAGLSGLLGAGQAALFTANGGTLSGHVFAVIDANGVAGYQAGEDLVIELAGPVLPIEPGAGVIV